MRIRSASYTVADIALLLNLNGARLLVMKNVDTTAMLVLLMLTGASLAQEARTRSLTFDPNKHEWIEKTAPPAGTPEAALFNIKMLNDAGSYRKANARVKAFTKQYGTDDSNYPEVLLEQAEALIGMRNFTDAHTTLQTFLSEFGGMTLTDEALRMELVVAEAFLAGAPRRVWRIFRFSGKDLAYRILDELSASYPGSHYAEAALKTKADHLFKDGEYGLAELAYARLLREYPRSPYHQVALRRTADAALASFAGTAYDEAALIEADARYREYAAAYPAAASQENVDAITEGIRQSRAEKDYLVGRYYEHTEHLSSAVFYYRLVQNDWPGTIAATKAIRRLTNLGKLERSTQSGADDAPLDGGTR